MATFRYTALDSSGQPVSGMTESANVREAVHALEGQGFAIRSIEEVEPSSPIAQQSAPVEASALRGPFEKLFAHRVPLIGGLGAFREELPSTAMRWELEQVIGLLEQGDVQQALQSFDSLAGHWTPLLSAAAIHTDSDEVLAEYLRRTDDFHQDWRRRWIQLAYPLLLILLAIVVMVTMSLMVIPTFREIFREFDLELPSATRIVLAIAAAIESGWLIYLTLALIVFGFVGWMGFRYLPAKWREQISRWTLGRGRRLMLVGQLEGRVADLLEAGLTPPQALRAAATSVHHPALAAQARRLADCLGASDGAFAQSGRRLLTHTFTQAMEQELADRSRIHLLRELGNAHADRVTNRLIWKQGVLFGPLAIVVVGLIVGFTVLALFLPLVRLVEGLT